MSDQTTTSQPSQLDRATPRIEEIDVGLWCIDLRFQGEPRVISAWLMAGPDGLALIETGPSTTMPALRAGIGAIGFTLADVRDVVVSHIHLDHSGAMTHVAKEAPEARIWVHPVGLPHLIDPARLWASAARIYGDRMERLWGDAGPVPTERVRPVGDGDTLRLAGRDLRAIHTPGHAGHHLALHDVARQLVFTGDAAGVRIPGTGYVCPPVPPPELDIPLWDETIATLAGLGARRLCLTHFGVVSDPAGHLRQLVRNLDIFRDLAWSVLSSGGDQVALAAALHDQMAAGLAMGDSGTADDGDIEALRELELATPSYMAALGLTRFLTRQGWLA